ncbi:unnamed protein product [Protopolystoma xenopodis]|uniref:Uncharacterized protein n=1 Tax=Protopolystoma xenopodis TaxID=117903 RepID=A0A448WUZ9_9PLAT|nr:unnamed protein product [Protopolystoma xenopodis]
MKAWHIVTGTEADCLGNSINMNVSVKPINSWSRGIRWSSSFGGIDPRILSPTTRFIRNKEELSQPKRLIKTKRLKNSINKPSSSD